MFATVAEPVTTPAMDTEGLSSTEPTEALLPLDETNVLSALLGIVFVVQLPSQQPQVIFQKVYHKFQVDNFCLGPGPVLREDPLVAGHAHEDLARPLQRAEPAPSGRPVIPVCSTEDVRAALRECFGIPANIFAKLMLPDEELCNRPFYLELDAGWRRTSHPHEPFGHLLFASFPCNVAEFAKTDASQARRSKPEPVSPGDRVQKFNIVHVLDSRLAGRREKHTSTLWHVSAHLSRALVSEELRAGYLSKEVQRIMRECPFEDQLCESENERATIDAFNPERSLGESHALELDQLLSDAFDGVHRQGHRSLRVNGSILCHVCVFPRVGTVPPPSTGQAIALASGREALLRELPADSAGIVRCVIDAADPFTSLNELMVRLALPLGTLQRVAQHLCYWQKAHVIEPFRKKTRVVIAPGVDTVQSSRLSRIFHEWQQLNRARGVNGPPLSLSEVLSAFAGGRTVRSASENLRRIVDFKKVLEWLVAEGLLMQLATFYHFLPNRAQRCKESPEQPQWSCGITSQTAAVQSVRLASPPLHLSEDDLELLSSRAASPGELLFLGRLVSDFARTHDRVDGCKFAALVESCDSGFPALGQEKAERLLASNRDILVPYVCRC